MAIDLGRKRCGIAVTDPLQIIANGLTTIPSAQLVDFVMNYLQTEEVETLVIGEPKDMKNNPSDCSKYIDPIVNRLKKLLPNMNIVRYFLSNNTTYDIASNGICKQNWGFLQRYQRIIKL